MTGSSSTGETTVGAAHGQDAAEGSEPARGARGAVTGPIAGQDTLVLPPSPPLPPTGAKPSGATDPTGASGTSVHPAGTPPAGVGGQTSPSPPLPGMREQCPVCGAPTAPDQRYCVECGQRLALARPLFMREDARHAGAATESSQRQSRWRMTPSSTLIAGIGTLLLAMGVGVLIGHLGQSSSPAHTTTPILTVPSTGAAGTSTTATTPGQTSTTASGAAGSSSATKASTTKVATPTTTAPTKAAVKPANPTVTVGQKGSGKGYQHGHFTGHFFGGESEEEANEEPSESSKGGSGSGSKGSNTSSGKGGKKG